MKSLKIVIINLLLFFIFLLVVENIIPFFSGIKVGNNRQLLIEEYNPNSKIKYLFNNKIYNKTIDNNGFSIDPKNFSSKFTRSIFFLGSSNVENLYVEEGKRMSDLTAKKINLIINDKFNSFNSGRGGLNSSHVLTNLIYKVIQQDPDYVFLMPTNDFGYLKNYGNYHNGPKKHFKEYNFLNIMRDLKNIFIPNIYVLLRSFIEFQIPELGVDDDLKIKSFSKIQETQLDEFENYFRSIVKICNVFNIKTIIGTQFLNIEAINGDELEVVRYMNNEINNIVRKVSREEGAILLDLESLVSKNYEYMYDAGHLNELGCDYVSDLISKIVIEIENEGY
jgi:hypothetical protein